MNNWHPDVIVIGAGVVGLFTAMELLDAGLRVSVLERGGIGREASWAGGGILSPLHPWDYPESVLALSRWSQAAYPGIANSLLESTGIDPEWIESGLLIQEPDCVQQALTWAQQHSTAIEVLTADDQAKRFPNLAPVESAIHLPSVAQVRNPRLLKSMAAFLRAKGVQILTGVAVEQIVIDKRQVRGVRTAQQQVMAERVVVAAGAWSGGIDPLQLPIKPVKGQMLLYAPLHQLLPVMTLRNEVYLIPRKDGHILVGSSVEDAGFDKTPTDSVKQNLDQQARAIFPALANARLGAQWAGIRPGSPGGVPFISASPQARGLFVNAGHFRHGLLTAPASARLLADMLVGRKPVINPEPYVLI